MKCNHPVRMLKQVNNSLAGTYTDLLLIGEDCDRTGLERLSTGLICEGWPSTGAVIGLPRVTCGAEIGLTELVGGVTLWSGFGGDEA
jgi:hypothetical protein